MENFKHVRLNRSLYALAEDLNIILILQIITITNEQHTHVLKKHKILKSE